ncbi:hypothetical protein B0H13DRAFT_2418605 [Mycena leptocephala]|nr:hypothetical protein B0H13DRAFT_2418605 [Mycena leptocephala]
MERRIRCFPPIVNLACKAVLGAITDMDFAVVHAIARDPVATVRTTVRVIRASSLRRQYFSDILKALQQKDHQLLRDVDTRWSSTLIMMDRAILLCEAIDKFLSDPQFRDLKKYKLGDKEWETLTAFKRILSTAHIVQHGIDKLESYRERVQDVPAYILSMHEFKYFIVVDKSGNQATLV